MTTPWGNKTWLIRARSQPILVIRYKPFLELAGIEPSPRVRHGGDFSLSHPVNRVTMVELNTSPEECCQHYS
ncbi:MAG: hypothetical protein HQL74_15470 [Magnetococcales bacterium]|nr:hypothetical protein [Magnetococcales bacterium]